MQLLADVNPLHDLAQLGQSIWLDELRRSLIGRELAQLIADDRVTGITSNPSIIAKAFREDPAYARRIVELRQGAGDAGRIYERLSVEDVRAAAEQLRRAYEHSDARDGYVSIEVPPALAHDADATVTEAHRLRAAIDRPNIMIKVPATDSGVHAVARLIADGINVNATLIFGTRRYQQVADAFMRGLEARVSKSKPVERIASVASLFVSRIDTLVDKQLDALQQPDKAARAAKLRGKAAVAVARIAYREYKKLIASHRWQALAARHASPQRLLWASTSTKDARYSDVKYVDELIGRDTVNTLPLPTLAAFRDHGSPAPRLESDLPIVATIPGELAILGVDLERVAEQLEREGLAAFASSMDALLGGLAMPSSN